MAPNPCKTYVKPKKPNPSSQKPNKMLRGTQKTKKTQSFLGHQPRPGPWDLKNIWFIRFFGYLTAFYLVFVEMDWVFWVSHCLFWVLAEKLIIYIVFFEFSDIHPIFSLPTACSDSIRLSSDDSLYLDLQHVLLVYVRNILHKLIINTDSKTWKKHVWTGLTPTS